MASTKKLSIEEIKHIKECLEWITDLTVDNFYTFLLMYCADGEVHKNKKLYSLKDKFTKPQKFIFNTFYPVLHASIDHGISYREYTRFFTDPFRIRHEHSISGSDFGNAITFILSLNTEKLAAYLYDYYIENQIAYTRKEYYSPIERKSAAILTLLGNASTVKNQTVGMLLNIDGLKKLKAKTWAAICQYILFCEYIRMKLMYFHINDDGKIGYSDVSMKDVDFFSGLSFLSGQFNQFITPPQKIKKGKEDNENRHVRNNNYWIQIYRLFEKTNKKLVTDGKSEITIHTFANEYYDEICKQAQKWGFTNKKGISEKPKKGSIKARLYAIKKEKSIKN